MVNDSYFRFDYDNSIKYALSLSLQDNVVSWRNTTPYIELKIVLRIDLILQRLTLDGVYLTSILEVQCLQISLHSEYNDTV